MTNKKELQERATTYGLKSLTNQELANLMNYKGSMDEFFISQFYKAAKELLRRQEIKEVVKILRSEESYKILNHLEGLDHEQFWVIYLKRNNAIIKDEFISKGGICATVVDVKLILKTAINLSASSIILCHNHPSGELRPSGVDVTITKQIKEACKLLDINVLDHVIIGNGQGFTKYYSFADEGMM
jgi:DNA repair protein RadC